MCVPDGLSCAVCQGVALRGVLIFGVLLVGSGFVVSFVDDGFECVASWWGFCGSGSICVCGGDGAVFAGAVQDVVASVSPTFFGCGRVFDAHEGYKDSTWNVVALATTFLGCMWARVGGWVVIFL